MSNDKKKSKIFIKNKTKVFEENIDNDFFENKKINENFIKNEVVETIENVKESSVVEEIAEKTEELKTEVENKIENVKESFENVKTVSLEKLEEVENETEDKFEELRENLSEQVENFKNNTEEKIEETSKIFESVYDESGEVDNINSEEKERVVYNSDIFLYDEETDSPREKKNIDALEEYLESTLNAKNEKIINDISNDERINNLFSEFDNGFGDDFKEEKSSNVVYDGLFEDEKKSNINLDEYKVDDDSNDDFKQTMVINKISNRSEMGYDEDDDDYGSVENYDYYINNTESRELTEDSDNEGVVKKKPVKKKKSLFRFFLKIFSLFTLACVIIMVYFALTHDLFKIDYIDIKGNSVTTREVIEEKGGVKIGDNIFLTSKKNILNNIKNIPTVEEVSVTKKYPNIIEINIKEKYVSGFINNNSGITTIDNYGKVQEISSSVKATTGIQLKGLSANGLTVGEDFTKDKAKKDMLLDLIQREYFNNILSLDFTTKELVMEFKDGLKVQFGEISDFSKKLDIISVLLEKIQAEKINAEEIILNVGDDPIIVKK